MRRDFRDEIRANKFKTLMLFAVFGVMMLSLAAAIAYWYDVCISFFIFTVAIIWALVSYFSGDRIVLRMSGAVPVTKQQNPYLYNVTEGLALAAGIPMPALYIINDDSPNAFATGRDPSHASIAVTTGLLNLMNRKELEGVIAHEMSHIRHLDIRTMMVAAVLMGIIMMVGGIFLRTFLWGGGSRRGGRGGGGSPIILIIALAFVILSPIIGQIIKLSISRKLEYNADAGAVELTRDPSGIRSALEKLGKDKKPLKRVDSATAHMYIESPTDKEEGIMASLGSLFMTHPPLKERVRRLREME